MHIDESIFGVKFDVSGEELVKHCEGRMNYHEGRRAFYAQEEKKFIDEVDELVEKNPGYSNKVAISNKERMADSKNHHANRTRFFRFAATHLKKESYELSQSELSSFEMIPM